MDADGAELLEVARAGEFAVIRDPTGEWWAEYLDHGADFDFMLGSVHAAFFREFEDDYAFLTIVLVRDFGLDFAFCQPLANDVNGLGFGPDFDDTPDSRVEAMIFMNHGWIDDPVAGRYVFAQEVMHRWGTYVGVEGLDERQHMGRDGVHWSFWMDTPNSPMEGNRWIDNGDGTWTTDGASPSTYSELDLYLMGFAGPEEVGEQTLLVRTSGADGYDEDSKPVGHAGEPDVTVRATAVRFDLDDIVAVEGRRRPNADNSPRDFRMGMIVLLLHDDELDAAGLTTLDEARARWETEWEEDVRGRATLDTTLGANTAPEFFAEPAPPLAEMPEACGCAGPSAPRWLWALALAALHARRRLA